MAFLEFLKEMLNRDQISDLAKNVAVMNVELDEKGEARKFLNLYYAENGEVEWAQNTNPGIFMMKGKFLRDIYPKVKGKLGKCKFIDREEVRKNLEYGSVSGIKTDVPRIVASMEKS